MAGGDGRGGSGEGDVETRSAVAPVGDADSRTLRTAVGAYAELVRVPNLFTAPPDVLLGAALVSLAGFQVAPLAVVGLVIASTVLYAAGTTLNDAFDVPIDERERPDRPIPSGRVARRTAFGLGLALLAVGFTVAFVAAGRRGATVAGLVAAAIVCYDGLTKGTAAGFLTMGATRGLNVVLGTTAGGVALVSLPRAAIAIPGVVAGYIAAITYMAAGETAGDNRGAVTIAIAATVGAVLAVGGYLAVVQPGAPALAASVLLAVAFLWWVGQPLQAAYADPTPATVGPAVGACVLGLVLLNAAFAAASGVGWAIVTASFLVPARTLSAVFDVT